jgi:hypothetical protein
VTAESRIQEFISRLLPARSTEPHWWQNLLGEVRQRGPEGRYLDKVLEAHLKQDIPNYRGSQATRNQFFFSPGAAIDGRFHGIGIEEKVAPLGLDKVMDGALCRGLVWALGNPQDVALDELGSVGLFVTKESKPLSDGLARAFLGALVLARSANVHFVFVNGQTGEYWPKQLDDSLATVPGWLAAPGTNYIEVPPVNSGALAELKALDDGQPRRIPGERHRQWQWSEDTLNDAKVARAKHNNKWRMLDAGLMLRAMGYEAVHVSYSGPRKEVDNPHTKVAARVAAEMRKRFGVILDWGVPEVGRDNSWTP